ncbi:TetR family transcriptional regulator [Tamaricihabitans halophyticus]|uniref:TetR family transcriptional regulator n=1 Tax=Tamaricihabitans halophyticus TaxID=1262583 RepID=A0A4R2QYI6_9PSEU|nr:TetR/AcrR family transcriptional regulator [Tamaricihabitans halophyticus]TCP54108.1 TetR family transcriptional regulator [Tamaricihabitans halophyticus]
MSETTPRATAREQILNAYEEMLVESGPTAVTLEAVAKRAGVSKGGLLYHFGSKDALLQGLLDRLSEVNERDLANARSSPDGVLRYYLRTSFSDVTQEVQLHRSVLAAIQMLAHDSRAAEALRNQFESWRELLREHIADPLTAELVAMVGDGIYLNAVLGVPTTVIQDNVDEVLSRLDVLEEERT